VATEAAAEVPEKIRFTVSGPVACVVSNIVATQSVSQQRRESAAQKVIFRVDSDAKDECVIVESQLRAAGVEGVKTTQKIQRYRPMVRDVIADTQAEQGGVVHFEPGAEFREINGVAEKVLGASVRFPGSLPVPAVFGARQAAAE